jgi:hypothetical protein
VYWRCTPTLWTPFFFQIAGLIHDQHGLLVTERAGHIAAQILTHAICVPPGTRE